MIKLLIEAIIVGIIVVIIGLMVNKFVKIVMGKKVPSTCYVLHDSKIIVTVFFLTGSLTHLLFELLGGNRWYCNNGVACRKLHLL